MNQIGVIGLVLVLANIAVSYKGFNSISFFDKYRFNVDSILIDKDYKRIITSGFLHVDWMHLIFNMLSLYAFSGLLEFNIGSLHFTLIYFVSMIGGDLLTLYVHRNHGNYSAVGASAAICGIIFASIALFPGLEIRFFGLPISIPSWIYGILYVLYSIYRIKSGQGNIGHEAHLGGAFTGMTIAILIQPDALAENYLPIACVMIPTIIFIYLIISRPAILITNSFFTSRGNNYATVDEKYNQMKALQQKELDVLLDKISAKGIDGLSKKEKQKLEELSK